MYLKLKSSSVALAWLLTQSVAAFATPQYQLIDLGVLPGYDSSSAYDLNDLGQVVGDSYLASRGGQAGHAFLNTGSSMSDLGTLGGSFSTALGINNLGTVVGTSTTSDGSHQAFRYDGAISNLGYSGLAYAINDAGTIVGSTGSGMFIVNSPNPIITTTLNARWGWDINNQGTFVGTTQWDIQAYSYSNGEQSLLGRLATGQVSNAYAINDLGDVVGESLVSGGSVPSHAFLYADGTTMIDLGSLGGATASSIAWDINNNREVVGTSSPGTGTGTGVTGFYWANGVMYDLNDLLADPSGYTITTALAINNVGQIAGSAVAPDGYRHAILLTPIPEPSNTALLAFGVILVLWSTRQVKRSHLARRS